MVKGRGATPDGGLYMIAQSVTLSSVSVVMYDVNSYIANNDL